MWIVKCQFISNDGTYTKEEIQALTKFEASIQYWQMIERWYRNLCKTMEISDRRTITHDERYEILLELIELNLKCKYSVYPNSTFEISMHERIGINNSAFEKNII